MSKIRRVGGFSDASFRGLLPAKAWRCKACGTVFPMGSHCCPSCTGTSCESVTVTAGDVGVKVQGVEAPAEVPDVEEEWVNAQHGPEPEPPDEETPWPGNSSETSPEKPAKSDEPEKPKPRKRARTMGNRSRRGRGASSSASSTDTSGPGTGD